MSQDNPAISGKRATRMGRETLLQKAVDEPDLSWRVLITLNIFRMLVAAVLLGLFFSSGEPRIFGDAYPKLFATTATIYLVFALVFSTGLRQRWAPASAKPVRNHCETSAKPQCETHRGLACASLRAQGAQNHRWGMYLCSFLSALGPK